MEVESAGKEGLQVQIHPVRTVLYSFKQAQLPLWSIIVVGRRNSVSCSFLFLTLFVLVVVG